MKNIKIHCIDEYNSNTNKMLFFFLLYKLIKNFKTIEIKLYKN